MKHRHCPPQKTNQAIGYIRVSTPGQRDDGVSLDAQRERITAWCVAMGYSLLTIYEDAGISGFEVLKRPGFQQALDAACACHGALVVYSLSRFARNTIETLQLGVRLQQAHADLVSLSENLDTTSAVGKMIFRFMATLAEFERDQASERTTMALQYKKTNGERISRHAPYGMRFSADGIHLEPDADEQVVITHARAFATENLSSRKIAKRLAGLGMVSRRGTIFTPSAIFAMVGD